MADVSYNPIVLKVLETSYVTTEVKRFILEKRTDNVPAQNQNTYDEFILRRRQCNP